MRPPEKAQMMKRWNIISRDGQMNTTIAKRRTSEKTEAHLTAPAPLHETKVKAVMNTMEEMRGDIQTLNVRGMQAGIAMLMGMSLVLATRTVGMKAEVVLTIEVGGDAAGGVDATVSQMADTLVEEDVLAMVAIVAPMNGVSTIMTNMIVVLRNENTGR